MICASCKTQTCFTGTGNMPEGCPEQSLNCDTSAEPFEGYMQYVSQVREKEINRIDELIEYAKFRGFKKIGMAGCIGLHDEMRVISGQVRDAGLKANTVICKTGGFEKKEMGVPSNHRITTETCYAVGSVACNPVAQALLLNAEKTDMNCILGLCSGHDSVFIKHSKAPTISLITKDRTNGHNPAAILYNFYGDNYFSRRPSPDGAMAFNKKRMKLRDIYRMIKKKRRG